jgi:hypothetical protein
MNRFQVAKLICIAVSLVALPAIAQSPGTFGPGYNTGYAMNMDVAMSSSRSGNDSLICGRSYSDDNEKARLLQMQAAGKCRNDARNAFTSPDSVSGRSAGTDISWMPTFKASKTRTTANLGKFVNSSRNSDPAGAAKMEQLFASSDVIGQVGGAMRSVGLRANDVSHAYALWWVSAWKASQGDGLTADAATYAAVADQAKRGLASSPEFTAATDAQKQEMAEALMVQAALIDGMMEEYASDPKMMKQVASAVKKGALASGIDLDSMTLTPDGFASSGKRRSEAADAVKGDERALAAANDAPADDRMSNTQLALIAAAGGAGLAGVFMFGKAMGKKG